MLIVWLAEPMAPTYGIWLMARLSNHQILDLAYKVGWRKAGDLERVLAIVLAESSGNTEAENRCCVGLMAINVLVHKQYTRAGMKDAEANMRAGFALWQRDGWRPWNSSRGGQILKGLEARTSASTWQVSPGVGAQGIGSAASEVVQGATNVVPGVKEIADAANRTTQWITTPRNIARVITIVIASVIVVGGVLILARPAVMEVAKVARG